MTTLRNMADDELLQRRFELLCAIEDNELAAYQAPTNERAAQYQTAANMARWQLNMIVAELGRRGLVVRS